jgi:Tfp pilus assembly PilM family ATPase
MKVVGLNIDKGRLAVSVVQRQFGKSELVDSFIQSFATDAELADILREKSPLWAGAKIVSSIPGHLFSQRSLRLPFADRKRIEKALPFEVEDIVPFDLGDVVLDHLALGNAGAGKESETQVLCMMLPKTVLRRHLDLLAGAGIDPQAIVPSYAGLFSIANMMPAESGTLLLCGSDICFRSPVALKSLRAFPPAIPPAVFVMLCSRSRPSIGSPWRRRRC